MSEKRLIARGIEDIEASLHLCSEMGSPSVVIPASTIEKHFAIERLPAHPDVPCYDLYELQEWAKAKGWTVAFATTGSVNDKRMLPGVRFTPLSENKPVADQDTKPSPDHWYKKPPAVIGIAVVSGLLLLGIRYLAVHRFGVPL